MVARFTAETVIACIWDVSHLLSVEAGKAVRADRVIAFLAILAHSLPDEGAADQTGVSVHALAQSFNRPFESTRRQVNSLIANGWCVRTRAGVAVAPDALAGPAVQGIIARLHDQLVWLVEHHRAFDLPLPTARPGSRATQRAVTLIAIEYVLAAVDFASLDHDNVREFYVVTAIGQGAVRAVTFDPVLARQYAAMATVPEDRHRQGVNLQAFCAVMGLPMVTVYRQVNKAIEAGRLERCPGGVRSTRTYLAGQMICDQQRRAVARTDRAFRRLAAEGFAFDDPASHYTGERPTLPDLGS